MKRTCPKPTFGKAKHFGVTALAAVIAATSQVTPSFGASLEEIVVTARKRDESLQDVSDQVSVFTSSAIEDAGIETLDDIAALTPGLYFSGSFFAGENVLTLRGSGQSANQSPPASFTIDGVTLQSSLLFVQPLLDIEQVEVLRGPQGTLYGRNSLGGAINITTKAPTDEFEGKIKVRGQEGSDISIQGSISGPIIPEVLRYRLTGAWEDRDGVFQSALDGHDVNDREGQFGRLKLLFTPNENLTLDWRFAINREESHPTRFQSFLSPGGVSEVQASSTLYEGFCPIDPVTGNFIGGLSLAFDEITPQQQAAWGSFGATANGGDVCPTDDIPGQGVFQGPNMPDSKNDWESFTQNLTWNINDNITLTSTTDYTTSELEGAAWIGYGRSQYLPALNIDNRDTFTQELRLAGGDDTALRWTVGLFYQDVARDNRTAAGGGFFPDGAAFQRARNDLQPGDDTVTGNELDPALFAFGAPLAERDVESKGVFFNVLYDLTETLELNVGARYDKVETINTDVNTEANPDLFDEAEFSDFQPKVSLAWQATEDFLIYATYSEGFRPGEVNGSDQFSPGSNVAQAEELSNLELGFKSSIGESVTLNGAIYSLDIDNWQYFNFTAAGRILQFAPEAEAFGAELALQWQATENLNISAGWSYTDTEVTEYGTGVATVDINLNPVTADAFNGSQFLYVPEQNLNITAQYTVEVADGIDFVARGDLAYVGDYFFAIDNVERFGEFQPAYTTGNIRIGLESEDWRVTGFVNNVNDREYFAHAWVGRQVNLPNSATTPGLPRIYGIELSYNF